MSKKFKRLITLALNARAPSVIQGLLKYPISNIHSRLKERLSETMTYDLHVHTLLIWHPASPITFMNSNRYRDECLSGPIQLYTSPNVDIKEWA
jgi:hypothetical protein